MKRQIRNTFSQGVIAIFLTAIAAVTLADELPKTSHDGLSLLEGTKAYAVYAKSGASLEQYKRVKLLDCYVAFRKDWQKDQNRAASTLDRHVSTNDMERIKERVAKEFKNVVTEELRENGGYELTDVAGEDVLIVRPAIINLDITAPDVGSTSRTFVTSAGSMTLYAELYDSATGDIIARVIDGQVSDRGGFAMDGSRMTNKVEADRIIRKWAVALRDNLGKVAESTAAEVE